MGDHFGYTEEFLGELKNSVFLIQKEIEKIQKNLTLVSSRVEYLQKRVDAITDDDK